MTIDFNRRARAGVQQEEKAREAGSKPDEGALGSHLWKRPGPNRPGAHQLGGGLVRVQKEIDATRVIAGLQ
eukprot:scaffold9148_cov45-Isochrysis_galbana.AAC.1